MKSAASFQKGIFGAMAVSMFFVFVAHSASALVINELMYDLAGVDDPHEWVEIKNSGQTSMTVLTGTGGWRFFDGSNHIINAPVQGTAEVAPSGFAILADDAQTFLADHPGFSGTVFDTVMSLSNTTDTLRLIDEGGSILDEAIYANTLGAAGNGKTLELKIDGLWGESSADGGTPGLQNSSNSSATPTPTPSPAPEPTSTPTPEPTPTPLLSPSPSLPPSPTPDPSPEAANDAASPTPLPTVSPLPYIHINEFLPNTKGTDAEEEWIELWNEGNMSADISGWKIDDAVGGSQPYTTPHLTSISSGGYKVFTRPITAIALNNDADVVRLLTPGGQIYESVSYEKPPQGASSNRMSQGLFAWSWTPTPGRANVISGSEPVSPKPSLAPPPTGGSTPTVSPAPSVSVDTAAMEASVSPLIAKTGYLPAPFTGNQRNSGEAFPDGDSSSSVVPKTLTANLSDAVSPPEPYQSFFSRHALTLTLFAAAASALGLVRWRRGRLDKQKV